MKFIQKYDKSTLITVATFFGGIVITLLNNKKDVIQNKELEDRVVERVTKNLSESNE